MNLAYYDPWSEHGTTSTKVVSSISIWAFHLRVGLVGSL